MLRVNIDVSCSDVTILFVLWSPVCSLCKTVRLLQLLSDEFPCWGARKGTAECILYVSCCPFTHVVSSRDFTVYAMLAQAVDISIAGESLQVCLRVLAWGCTFLAWVIVSNDRTCATRTFFSTHLDLNFSGKMLTECGVSALLSIATRLSLHRVCCWTFFQTCGIFLLSVFLLNFPKKAK